MNFSISNIPQADELERVILTVEAVQAGSKSDKEIADYVGFTDRQGRYYRLAAEILGLIRNQDNSANLTAEGESLIELDEKHRLQEIRNKLLNDQFFNAVLTFIEINQNGVNKNELVNFLTSIVVGAKSTIERRLYTILNWLLHVNLINIDYRELSSGEKENVYVFNNLLEDDIEDEASGSIYPVNYENDELDIRETHMQVISLVRRSKQDKITVPEFQRNLVWKQQQKSRFIESLILNVPIPPFYISQDLEGKYIIVDGLQRTSAILDFLSNKYKLVGLEALPKLNGLYFSDLEESVRARIEDRDLLLYVLRPTVPMEVVYDIFNRINSNGTPLTRQEIRNCIFIGPATRLLHELSELAIFRRAIDNGISPKRMKDQEAILRFLAFSIYEYKIDYQGDMDAFLGKTMKMINRLDKGGLTDLRKRFIRVMSKSFEFFEYQNFRLPTEFSRGRINIALMEVVCYYFDKKSDEYLEQNKLQIRSSFKNLLEDKKFIESVRLSTSSPTNVKYRFDFIMTSL